VGAVERLNLALFVDRQHQVCAGGSTSSPTVSVSLAAKLGSRERLKVRSRCGCSLCARQMRCTEPSEMPMALAIGQPKSAFGALDRGRDEISCLGRAEVGRVAQRVICSG
jgi:hypothetical protein